MSTHSRAAIESIYRSAVAQVDAGAAVERSVARSDGDIVVTGMRRAIPAQGIYAIAFGKAALPMARTLEHQLGEVLRSSIAVAKNDDGGPRPRARVLFGSHPTPDARSLAAGAAVWSFAEQLPRGALVFCLISGGGSSLMELPRDETSLEQISRLTAQLLDAGASISELNAVRSRLSKLKGGGLLRALDGCHVCNLVVSDVLGDPPTIIASGPTMPAAEGEPAEDVLQRFRIAFELPPPIPSAVPSQVEWHVIANVSGAIDAAAQQAATLGLQPFVLTRSLAGEAREVAGVVTAIALDTARGKTTLPSEACIIAGGETVVTVRGNGNGGRNTEGALAAALLLQGEPDVTIGFLATDGDDARTGLAGGIVDGRTIGPGDEASARAALANNDSATILERLGAAFRTGPTATNVNDLVIAIVGKG
ncbi:MAG: hydroxypyruvate reductase [Chloroflexi bacterium]|nr:MAG: hydroxypyruvate reductase [Chloroflexota bacterium]